MAKFIYEFEGVRGRNLKLYDTKVVITTNVTIGSFITGNVTDGEKTIFLQDVVGVQFKKSGGLIGYLQFETPSMQMNNKGDNMFSENTFTFENGKNGITNDLMVALYNFVTDRIEELKYGTTIINDSPNFESMKTYTQETEQKQHVQCNEADTAEDNTIQKTEEKAQRKAKKEQLSISDLEDAASSYLNRHISISDISCTLIYVIPESTGKPKEMHLDMAAGNQEFTSLDLFFDQRRKSYYFKGRKLALDGAWRSTEEIFGFDVALFKSFTTEVDTED